MKGAIIFGIVHEGNGTDYHGDLPTAVAVAEGLARRDSDGSIWIEEYRVKALTKGTLLAALSGGGWADSIRRVWEIRK